ncbi:unnamed protein product, partial [Didymodactylos carnosus]
MGCGTSNPTAVQNPSKVPVSSVQNNQKTNEQTLIASNNLNKKSVLPSIEQRQTKTTSAGSNHSSDSGYSDDNIATAQNNSSNGTSLVRNGYDTKNSRVPVKTDTSSNVNDLLVQHHQKSRLGLGETFEITATPTDKKFGTLAPLKFIPRFLLDNEKVKPESLSKDELQAKLEEKQERASRKRRELENARRQASSRMGQRMQQQQSNANEAQNSTDDDRHQRLTLLRDKLCQNGTNASGLHSPRTPRPDSMNSGISDISQLTPRRAGFLMGSTSATHFKPFNLLIYSDLSKACQYIPMSHFIKQINPQLFELVNNITGITFLSDQEEDETDKIINSLNDKSKQLETADDEKSSNNEGLIVDIENHIEDRKTHVADLVRLCDTTPVSIQECMKKFCLISNQLRFAWQFLNKTEYSCQTIKSFAYALQKQLQLIRFQLANIERETFEQSRIYTTLSFYQELETLAITSKAHLIDRIFNESSLLNNKSLSHRDQALELIHVLYQNLLIVEALDINVSIDFMLPIFTASCSVYLLIIEQWLKNGELHDPYDEFIVL